jgi:U2 small nuclear ribonucleoprotein B''
MSSNTPNTTLYIHNLNDSINKEELRAQLYALFLPYGTVLDVVALKTAKMRGQAFVVFEDLAAATTAMRSWDGESFYDKPMVRCYLYPYVKLVLTRACNGLHSVLNMQRQSHGPH